MNSILTRQVAQGFDATIRDPSELPRGSAADGSQNVLYSRDTIKTPYGFGQVESGSLPLDSGAAILANFMYSELDKTQHFLSVTGGKIYNRDYVNSEWDDVTQSGQPLAANIYNPISMASVLHTDGLALNGTGDDWYHHCCICTGISPVQRWAGKFEADFADLVGADGYHTVGSSYTTHYALQMGAFYNRPILISPLESDAADTLHENNQRIRWPQAGKLESWAGNGAGYVDLLDTGGFNVWGALLGPQWIQYQNNSIWSLTHVGGTRVFEPDIEMPDLGLLAPHLLFSKNNVHYFVGNDYNIYAYWGGSNYKLVGHKIHRYLQRDLDPNYKARCWLCMGAENSRLWLFIVPNDREYAIEAYGIDIRTGAWMKRDFTHKWPTGGITSVALIGSGSYQTGQSYARAVTLGTTYAAAVTAGTTYRQVLTEVLTNERLVLGDSAGYVYQYDSDLIQDDSVDIPSRHITEVYDLGVPGKEKIWPGFEFTAKGTSLIVDWRTSDFDTVAEGWSGDVQDCVGSWRMNENDAGTTVKDYSGEGNDGVSSEATSGLQVGEGFCGGGSFYLGSGPQQVTIPDATSLDFGTGDFTAVFAYYPVVIGQSYMFYKWVTGVGGFSIEITAGRKVRIEIDDGTNTVLYTDTTILSSSVLSHIAVVFNRNGNATIYINGAEKTSVDISSVTGSINSGSDLILGGVEGAGIGSGWGDCFNLFDRALSLSEIKTLYSDGDGLEPDFDSVVTTLSADWANYQTFINTTSKKIQFRLRDYLGAAFQVSDYSVIEPAIMG